MNPKLVEEIVFHMFANLGILHSEFINVNRTKSLIDNSFLLPEKLSFEIDDSPIKQNNLYGCQSIVLNQEIKMLLADCSLENELLEYCLFVQLKDNPAYCCYIVHSQEDRTNSETLLAINQNNKGWLPCTMYLHATFLAAMEQFRDLNSNWTKCSNYKIEYQQLLNFIKFHQSYYDDISQGNI